MTLERSSANQRWHRRLVSAATSTAVGRAIRARRFSNSASYWESRYASGGNSGPGSYEALARFKADTLNDFVKENNISTIGEFGCGDGQQLRLAQYRSYVGYDVSKTAVDLCRALFAEDASKRFYLLTEQTVVDSFEMTLSLDVIYHLVEDETFDRHLQTLFSSSRRYVCIYSSDLDDLGGQGDAPAPHIRHRPLKREIKERFPEWNLVRRVESPQPYDGSPQTTFASFSFYHNG